MPLTMKPNFEDHSCDMVFGLTPQPIDDDEAMQQSCLQKCDTALFGHPQCHKLK